MSQSALFHDSILEALREVVMTCGGLKFVGARMRPDLSPDHAGRWLSDCLSEDRRERLTPGQMLFLMREGRNANCHVAATFLLREAGYADPIPVSAEDEQSKLMREFVDAQKAMQQMVDRMARLNVQAVKQA